MAQLQRQQSSQSYQFEVFNASAAQYFCCFGYCHSKTVGVFVFLIELLELIGLAIFLFLKSAGYNSQEWQSTEVLWIVGVTLIGLICLGISTALLFMGVCCEESSLIIPYMARQTLLTMSMIVLSIACPNWVWHTLSFGIVQCILLLLAYGTYKYFSDKEKFHAKPDFFSRKFSHRNPRQKLSLNSHNMSSIDIC